MAATPAPLPPARGLRRGPRHPVDSPAMIGVRESRRVDLEGIVCSPLIDLFVEGQSLMVPTLDMVLDSACIHPRAELGWGWLGVFGPVWILDIL